LFIEIEGGTEFNIDTKFKTILFTLFYIVNVVGFMIFKTTLNQICQMKN